MPVPGDPDGLRPIALRSNYESCAVWGKKLLSKDEHMQTTSAMQARNSQDVDPGLCAGWNDRNTPERNEKTLHPLPSDE
jgi:hypothetical protein